MKKVAVITRTKNREVLLRRAKDSLLWQSLQDYVWVIVNDGGRTEGVEKIAGEARAEGVEVILIHNPESLGMEAASNIGVRASESRFIVIHDDDDSWRPEFLRRTVEYLESDEGQPFKGVVTHSAKIMETLEDDKCDVLGEEPFNPWLTVIALSDMARMNSYPPISFLFERAVYDAVGGYDERLPVLGDWDFNLRFLLHADIAVIPEILANYHHRVNTPDAAYQNTVTHGVSRHVTYDVILRNRYLREDIRAGRPGLGMLISNARNMHELNGALRAVLDRTTALEGRVNALEGTLNDSINGRIERAKLKLGGSALGRGLLRALGGGGDR